MRLGLLYTQFPHWQDPSLSANRPACDRPSDAPRLHRSTINEKNLPLAIGITDDFLTFRPGSSRAGKQLYFLRVLSLGHLVLSLGQLSCKHFAGLAR